MTISETALGAPTRNLLRSIRRQGYECTPTATGDGDWLFAHAPYTNVEFEGTLIEVWEFASAPSLSSAVASVTALDQRIRDPDNSTFPSAWPAPVHFFRGDRVIVLYFAVRADRASGRDEFALAALTRVLGPEFVGSPQ